MTGTDPLTANAKAAAERQHLVVGNELHVVEVFDADGTPVNEAAEDAAFQDVDDTWIGFEMATKDELLGELRRADAKIHAAAVDKGRALLRLRRSLANWKAFERVLTAEWGIPTRTACRYMARAAFAYKHPEIHRQAVGLSTKKIEAIASLPADVLEALATSGTVGAISITKLISGDMTYEALAGAVKSLKDERDAQAKKLAEKDQELKDLKAENSDLRRAKERPTLAGADEAVAEVREVYERLQGLFNLLDIKLQAAADLTQADQEGRRDGGPILDAKARHGIADILAGVTALADHTAVRFRHLSGLAAFGNEYADTVGAMNKNVPPGLRPLSVLPLSTDGDEPTTRSGSGRR